MRYANVANSFMSALAPPTPVYVVSDWLERGLLCCGGQPVPLVFLGHLRPVLSPLLDLFTVLSVGSKLAQMLTTR